MNPDCVFFDVCQNKEECSIDCIRYSEIDFLLKHSGLPLDLRGKTILYPDKVDLQAFYELANIKDNIVNFVKEGHNLYLYSDNVGNGKSSWLAKLLKTYFYNVWAGNGYKVRGYFLNIPTFLIKLKENIRLQEEDMDELKEIILNVDLLCMDDIAASTLSEFEHNYLLYIIEYRLSNKKSILYSSNMDESGLVTYLGNRLKSRVFNSSKIIRLQGMDRRGINA